VGLHLRSKDSNSMKKIGIGDTLAAPTLSENIVLDSTELPV
jgi:hypothetical protein